MLIFHLCIFICEVSVEVFGSFFNQIVCFQVLRVLYIYWIKYTKSFTNYVSCKYFYSIHGLSFHSFDGFFTWHFQKKKLWKTLKWLNAPPYKKSLLNVLFIYSLELYMSFTVFELIYSIVSIRKLIIIMILLLKIQINCVQNVTDYCLEDRTVYKFSSVFLIVCIALVLWIILWTGCNILLVS